MKANASFNLLRRLDCEPLSGASEDALTLIEGQFLGIVGLRIESGVWDVGQALRLQPVQPRSGAHEISRVLLDERVAAIVARYSSYVSYELVVSPSVAIGTEAVDLGKGFISLLRVRSLPEILVPAALPCSWSAATLNRLNARSCEADLIEDIPNLLQLDETRIVSVDDLQWIFDNLSHFQWLMSTSAAYALAVDSLCQHNHQSNLRMAAAMIWSGIEALFGMKGGETTYRLALYISAILEGPGAARYELFKKTKEEYNTRSRIVHGSATDEEAIRRHILKARSLLSRLICRMTESQGVPATETLDKLISGETATLLAPSAGNLAEDMVMSSAR